MSECLSRKASLRFEAKNQSHKPAEARIIFLCCEKPNSFRLARAPNIFFHMAQLAKSLEGNPGNERNRSFNATIYIFLCMALGPRLAKLLLYSYMFIVFQLSYFSNSKLFFSISLPNIAHDLAASSSPHSIWGLPLRQRLAQREGAV